MFAFSSEDGMALVCQLPHDLSTPCDHQLEVVTKALDGTDVLVFLPTGAGQTVIPMLMLGLNHSKENMGKFLRYSA